MPLIDRRKVWTEWLQRFLEPGESVLALQAAHYTNGVEDRGQPDGPVAFDPILGLDIPALNRAAETLVGGVTLVGPPGSLAEKKMAAFGPDGGDDLLLTERRLLVLGGVGNDETGRVHAVVPREHIAAVRHRRRLVQAGLLDLTFVDGSALTLMLGLFTAGGAKRFVAAWAASGGRISS